LTQNAAALKEYTLDVMNRRGVGGNLANVLEHRSDYRHFMYGSCWHAGQTESDAMWRLYVGETNGIAIRTTLGRIQDHIVMTETAGRVITGMVRYLDYSSAIFDYIGPVEAWFCKRVEFAFESEFRLLFLHTPPEMFSEHVRKVIDNLEPDDATSINIHPSEINWNYPTPDGFLRRLDLHAFIVEFVLPPRIDERRELAWREIIYRHVPHAKVRRSSLDAQPSF
jgi:hypothetical protein